MPQIITSKCSACGDCITICPTNALGWQDEKAALLHPERCNYCAVCEDVCPSSAIELPYLIVKRDPQAQKEA